MAFMDTLLEMGYTPQGMPRRTIDTDTGQMGFEDKSTLGTLTKSLQKFMLMQQKEQERLQKEAQRKFDMYKTLREAGYDSQSAFESAQKGTFPARHGGESMKMEQEKAALAKTKAETKYIEEGKQGSNLTVTFRQDVNRARTGEIDWEELEDAYPDKIDTINKIKKQVTKVSQAPSFKTGTGGLISRMKSFFSTRQAEITPTTQKVIDNIKTEADLEELKKNRKDYEANGVDVRAILEYFGEE